ncbi:MAG: carboxylating nicotinate-nucleotide diphosphorylase [Euryarchaeota archaeon]|nr:carboxylating nicotinate-nucleotide diphosphorylase [Euryarchaeota archaeon]
MGDIDRFLDEDLGEAGDITSSAVLRGEKAEGVMVAREDCVVAGLEEACQVFESLGAVPEIHYADGDAVPKGDAALTAVGGASAVLSGERLALNFVMRMSGIATLTRGIVDSCRAVNPEIKIAATRKTTPGFRAYEKKAVALGGGVPHRSGLYDMALVKDNHIVMCGGVKEALSRLKERPPPAKVEIEVTNLQDALLAAEGNVDVIMLDNVPPEEGERIASEARKINPKVEIEASGGITPESAPKYARWANAISLGALTHSYKSIDFSMDIRKVDGSGTPD